MKKRLLSAALALAMVLTMLPLTAFAASSSGWEDPQKNSTTTTTITWRELTSGDTKTSLSYYKAGATLQGYTIQKDGWYTVVNSNGTYSGYGVVDGSAGVMTSTGSGYWYPTIVGNGSATADKQTNIVLLSNNTEFNSVSVPVFLSLYFNNFTIDLNGHTLAGTLAIPATYQQDAKTVNNTFSSLTIKDSKASTAVLPSGTASTFSVTVAEAGTDKAKTTNTTVQLENVNTSGTVGMFCTTSGTVNLQNAACASIQINSTSGGTINVGYNNTRGQVGWAALYSTSGGKINFYNGTTTASEASNAVALYGSGSVLTATSSTLGKVALFGRAADTFTTQTESQKNTLDAPKASLIRSSATAIVQNGTGEALTKNYTVELSGDANGGDITLPQANITITNAKAGTIDLDSGNLTVTGSATGLASTGNLTLGASDKTVNFEVKGTNVTIGEITATAGTVNMTTPASETNTFGKITKTVKIANKGISGGVFSNQGYPDAANLVDSLRFRVARTNSGGIVYYSESQFQKLIDEYAANEKNVISILGDNISSSGGNTITIKNGTEKLTVIKYWNSNMSIALPQTVNGINVLKWTEYQEITSTGTDGSTTTSEKLLGEVSSFKYSTPLPATNIVLNAQVTDNAITKLENVTSKIEGLTARLNGTVITLSGAVPSKNCTIELDITTDGKPSASWPTLAVVYDNGSVRFAHQNIGLPEWLRVGPDDKTLVINGVTTYTLNGSALRVQATGLPAAQIHGYTKKMPVIVNASGVGGTGWTNDGRRDLANTMSSDVYHTFTEVTDGSSVDFSKNPAVKELLNAAVAGITDSQIDSWLLNAQNAAWRKVNNNTNPNADQRKQTGYDQVHVVAYMAVNLSNYSYSNTPGTLTMTLTPSYYVEVRQSNPSSFTAYKLDENNSTELNYLRPVQNRSLGNLTGDMGEGIELKLVVPSNFTVTGTYAHQGGTYVYRKDFKVTRDTTNSMTFTITHTMNNALGSFVVNGSAPMVTLYDKKGTGNKVLGYYDLLQPAVDDAEEGNHINVDSNFTGNCNISVTGKARKFTIDTHGKNKVTSNVSGVVTEVASGSEYQIQLERDNIVSTTVSVSGVTGGTMTANVTSTRPGQTVTLTANPSAGYQVGTPTVRTNTGAAVSVSALGNNTFSFVVPAGATSISVTPSFVLNTGLPFTDVPANAWYFDGVKYCYNTMKGGYRLMEGFSATQFGPNSAFTRAEVVTILWNMKGRPTPGYAYRTYSDVPTSHWAYNAITWATNKGYAEGYPGGTFRPSQSVTREEMVVFLWRAAGKPAGYSSLSLNGYTDGYNVHDWAQNAMKWALAYGILSGQNSVSLGGTIAPRAVAYRSQVAVTVMNFDKLKLF